MKMLFIHQHFYPEESGTAKSCTEMAVYFASQGHNVAVITGFPNRSFKSITESKEDAKEIDVYKGVRVHRLKNRFQYSSNKVKRILAYLMFTINSCVFVLKFRSKFDISITIQSLPSAIPGIVLQLCSKVPNFYYCTDMMLDMAIASGIIKNRFTIQSIRFIENFIYNHSKAVFAVTPTMAESIRKRVKSKNIFVLSDWVDADFFNKYRYTNVEMLKEKYDLINKKVILYIGNIGFVQNLMTIVETAKKMESDGRYKEYIFLIGGTGVQKKLLESKSNQYGLKNIKFIGVVDRQYVPSFLQLSSILLMNYVDNDHMGCYRSSKIFDYIIAEKPIIVGAIGELAKIVEENNLGVVAHPSDSDDFFRKLQELILLENKISINNKNLIDQYSMDNVLSKFYETICKRLKGGE